MSGPVTKGPRSFSARGKTMWYSTRRWLAGSALAVLVVLGGAAAPALYAQQPPAPAPVPPTTAQPPSPAPDGPALAPPDAPRDHVSLQKQGDLLRFSRNVPGDAKPIVIDADEIFTWDEDGK